MKMFDDDQLLAAYVDGTLEPVQREHFEARLAEDAHLRAVLRDVRAAVDQPSPVGVAAPAARRVLDAAPWQRECTPSAAGLGGFAPFAAIAAAVLLAVGIGVFGRSASDAMRADSDAEEIAGLPVARAASPARLRDPDVYVDAPAVLTAQLAIDKPVYRPGEPFHARAVLLAADTKRPTPEAVPTTFQLAPADGVPWVSVQDTTRSGVAACGVALPTDLAGGAYELRVTAPGCAPATTTFDVRAVRLPRLTTEIALDRAAYGAGDRVTATLTATRVEGGIPADATVRAEARLDGVPVHYVEGTLDADGQISVAFDLPEALHGADGLLALSIDDGGAVETAARRIPIVSERLDVAFHPEGGALVAGVPCRLYLEARTPSDDPADLEGRILDARDREVARVATEHEGRARVTFTPEAGAAYRLVVERPAGTPAPLPLPPVQPRGIALRALADGFDATADVDVALASPTFEAATVVLAVRHKELDRRRVRLPAGREVAVRLRAPGDVVGALRVTVFDAAGEPVAERLVWRRPAGAVTVAFEVTPPTPRPASRVDVHVTTRDEGGRPTPAVVGLRAVNEGALGLAAPRDRAPTLPASALLGASVRELKDAAAYLDGGPEAETRIDLLLGTQGWRRFAYTIQRPIVRGHHGFVSPIDFMTQVQLIPSNFTPPSVPLTPHDGFSFDGAFQGYAGNVVLYFNPNLVACTVFPVDEMTVLPNPTWARVYAHRSAGDLALRERSDFTETVYWNAALETDDRGEARFSFDVSDALATYRISGDAFTADGRLGAGQVLLPVTQPLSIEPKLPLEVSWGDRLQVPVALVNGTDQPMSCVVTNPSLDIASCNLPWSAQTDVGADDRSSILMPLEVPRRAEPFPVLISCRGGIFEDSVRRDLVVAPLGFPVASHAAGTLDAGASFDFVLPETLVPGTVEITGTIQPSLLATMTEAVTGLLAEPGGCFEQTSATNHPNVLALRILEARPDADEEALAHARGLLQRGYARLRGFECAGGGFDWFGKDPGHVALTAYGLWELHAMAPECGVDEALLQRTRTWLLGRRDGEGAFAHGDTGWVAPVDVSDAYTLWCLAEAGVDGFETEVARLADRAEALTDPYVAALAARALWRGGRTAEARLLADRLAEHVASDGGLDGAETSITGSAGLGLRVETTALAVLAWTAVGGHEDRAREACRWLVANARDGRFGSTQGTMLALEALLAAEPPPAARREGEIVVRLDGEDAGRLVLVPGSEETLVLPAGLGRGLGAGAHRLELSRDGGWPVVWAATARHREPEPPTHPDAPLAIETSAPAEVVQGAPVEVEVRVSAAEGGGTHPMAVAIVGLPGGLEPRHDALQALAARGTIDAYETRGRDVVLYWRSLEDGAVQTVSIPCIAEVPGTFTGPASRAYLYYQDEAKHWAPGLRTVIVPR